MAAPETGCLVCGRALRYFEPARKLKCEQCGGEFESSAACEEGHFICDGCHSRLGFESVTEEARRTRSRNPAAIAEAMMRNKFIHMHGPEHHYLVAAALLAACRNSGGEIDLEKALAGARQRAGKVPGGICGLWGCCGAGVGAGIFLSLATGATPLSEKEWRLANQMTSAALEAIARHGGPRCCKRDAFLAVLTAVDFVRDRLGVEMEKPEALECSFYPNNPSCKGRQCPFFPAS